MSAAASASSAPRDFVLHDRAVPACLRVSRALRLPLWGRDSLPLRADQRLVVVLARPADARQVVQALRARTEPPPALVVSWGLPERHRAALLHERVPVVDGSVVAEPTAALEALDSGWDDERFAAELELAEALAEMEAHLTDAVSVASVPAP
jgi:hypothetical protein